MDVFSEYRAAGMCVIPRKGAFPAIKWAKYQQELPTPAEAAAWDTVAGYQPELVCGAVSGVVALDIDTDDEAVQRQVEGLAGVSPVKKKGSKGFTAFYRYGGESKTVWKRDGKVLVELLSNKHLCAIPPGLHRVTGKPYQWMGAGLLDVQELPALPQQFVAVMDMLYPRDVPRAVPVMREYDAVLLEDAEAMLGFVDAGCARDEWVRVGMALHSEYGDAARGLWHEWSAKSEKYKPREADAVWRSFSSGGVSIGSLVHMAKLAGYQVDRLVGGAVSGSDIEGYAAGLAGTPGQAGKAGKCEVVAGGVGIAGDAGAAGEEITAHGLVGEIADWITSTAIRPQPVLSLAAALAFMAMVKGHRVRGKTDLRTNLLIMGLAPTASGKEHPQYCLRKLADACDLGDHMMGEPVSGAGMLQGIEICKRVSLLVMDELGRFLKNLTGKQSGVYQNEIIDYMIKLFSKANTVFQGRVYADQKRNPYVTINQPHFCCLGFTVRERMEQACSSSDMIDGFLNRWIVFNVDDRGEERRDFERAEAVPEKLVSRITTYMKQSVQYDMYNNPCPDLVLMSQDAWEVMRAFKDEMSELIDTVEYPFNQLYVRAAEHAEKIAMVFAERVDMGSRYGGMYESIEEWDVEAAIRIVKASNAAILRLAGRIADNEHEAEFIRVRELIRECGVITKSALTRKTQFLRDKKRRNEIVESLLDSGIVAIEQHDNITHVRWIG